MKKENKPNGTAPVTSQAKRGEEIEAADVFERIESHIAKGNKTQWGILRTLESINATLNILAAQKKREVDPEPSESEQAR